jgi:hypothetical protein
LKVYKFDSHSSEMYIVMLTGECASGKWVLVQVRL